MGQIARKERRKKKYQKVSYERKKENLNKVSIYNLYYIYLFILDIGCTILLNYFFSFFTSSLISIK